jgi:hypothetical protein
MFGQIKVGNDPIALTGADGDTNEGFDFVITNSCRFNDNDTAYLHWTPGSAGNQKTWTFSAWVKRSTLDTRQTIFGAAILPGIGYFQYGLLGDDRFSANIETSAGGDRTRTTVTEYRDAGAWNHVVVAFDSTDPVGFNRCKIFMNGIKVDTTISTVHAFDTNGVFNAAVEHRIGRQSGSTNYFDGYLADVNFVDGAALGPEYFGEFNSHGLWRPVDTAGTISDFGLNGFRLEFKNSSDLGEDTAPLTGAHVSGNDFTSSGLAATDQMIDSPTGDTATGAGNACTWNPIGTPTIGSTYSDGNLSSTGNSIGSMAVMTGKWYFEIEVTGSGRYNFGMIEPEKGISSTTSASPAFSILFGTSASNTVIYKDGASDQTGANITPSGFVVGIEVNLDDGEAKFYVNGVQQLSNLTGITTGIHYAPFVEWATTANNTNLVIAEDDWNYTPSSSLYKSLSSAYITNPVINNCADHFETVLYSGNGVADRKITGLNFKPDLIWIKDRDTTNDHMLYDSVRGAHLSVSTNTQAAQVDDSGVSSFDSNGFTLGSLGDVNTDANRYVAWCWNAGLGDPVQNNNGTIQSLVKANPLAGFSILTYHGNSTANATVGHGLTQAPEFVWVKNTGTVESHMTDFVAANRRNYFFPASWAGTAVTRATDTVFRTHTASVLQWGSDPSCNTDYDYVAYAWHSVPGFSKIGYYTGNASASGPFIYTGFKPAFVMIKATAGSTQFVIRDNKRDLHNPSIQDSLPSATTAEPNNSGDVDFLANGFKLRGTGSTLNASSGQFFYIAFAEAPFKYNTTK